MSLNVDIDIIISEKCFECRERERGGDIALFRTKYIDMESVEREKEILRKKNVLVHLFSESYPYRYYQIER